MQRGKRNKFFLINSLIMVTLIIISASSFAEAEQEKLPARAISMAAEYPGVEISKDEDVSLDIIFHNKGRKDEDVEVWIAEKPENWQARIKTYRFTVTGVHVPSDEDKSLTFEANPEESVKPGEYKFRINARTLDGKFKMSQTVTIKVSADDGKPKEPKGVKLTTSYPVIRGPSDATFEFS
jgi:uncharacterized membrane protein